MPMNESIKQYLRRQQSTMSGALEQSLQDREAPKRNILLREPGAGTHDTAAETRLKLEVSRLRRRVDSLNFRVSHLETQLKEVAAVVATTPEHNGQQLYKLPNSLQQTLGSPASHSVAGDEDSSTQAAAENRKWVNQLAFWKEPSHLKIWALRGKLGVVVGESVEDLQAVMNDVVEVTAINAPMLRSLTGFRVLEFRLQGVGSGSREPIADHFDTMTRAIVHLLRFGLQPELSGDALCLARMQPMFAALRDAADSFRACMRRHRDLLSGDNIRTHLATLIDSDMQSWVGTSASWIAKNFDPSIPPFRFKDFPQPPVVHFEQVTSFVRNGGYLLRFFKLSSSDGESRVGGGGRARKGGHDSRGRKSAKRELLVARAEKAKRIRPSGV
ncbi:unnamed protein product [Scytosiphon promiscuus]